VLADDDSDPLQALSRHLPDAPLADWARQLRTELAGAIA